MMRRRGSVLVGLLWCLALLSVMVVGVLHTATLEVRLAKNQGDEIQAHYLALAGIEKAKALLYHESWERRRSHVHHSGKLENAPEEFRDVALGRGLYRVFHQGRGDRRREMIYGVTDEESRLNVNRASAEELGKLPGMTPELAARIIDYRDSNNEVTQGGAEEEQYAAQTPPRRPRNGSFLTRRELLSVLGMVPELFQGEDANLNGLLDDNEKDGNSSRPTDDGNDYLDAGWSDLITVESQVRNVDAAGQSRVNLKEASVAELSAVPGLSKELAQAIEQHRNNNNNNNNFENLADLFEVRAPDPNNPSRGSRNTNPSSPIQGGPGGPSPNQNANNGSPSGGGNAGGTGTPLINESLFMEIADELTTVSERDLPGVVNINTASEEVLMCLEGITRELAHEIVSYRESSGFFSSTARLLEVPGMTRDIWKGVSPRISANSQTYRILSEGQVPSTGARRRIEAVIYVGTFYVDTLAYREDDL